jgi:AraC-like DNA-binding protein
MPTLVNISPSKQSQQPLNRPITVLSRSIEKHCVISKHSHDWGQFVYAHKGVLVVATDAEQYIVPPEQGVWLLPNIAHQVTAISNVELTSFYIEAHLLHKMPANCCVLKVDSFLNTLIVEANTIADNYQWRSTDGRLLRLILDRLTIAPNVLFQLPYPKDARLLNLLVLLQKDPANRNNLTQWGKLVGASARTLSRLFQTETGLSYRHWRQRLMIQIAISRLSTGESVTSIAHCLGYESASAFIFMFKQSTGMTPTFYRDTN